MKDNFIVLSVSTHLNGAIAFRTGVGDRYTIIY